MPIFMLRPGWVQSSSDGGWHFITFETLRNLYGLKPSQCRYYKEVWGGLATKPEHPVLTPKYDGDYTLPTQSKQE
jgi:hypothetical protein